MLFPSIVRIFIDLIKIKLTTMSNNGNTLVGFLAGAAIGALTGILFAPEKASVTRERIKVIGASYKAPYGRTYFRSGVKS